MKIELTLWVWGIPLQRPAWRLVTECQFWHTKMEKVPKPLVWIGSSRKDLKGFPLEVRKTFGFALWQAQNGGKHLNAKVLKGFKGGGVLEVVDDFDGSTFRAVYSIRFAGLVFVLHAFQKKSKKGIKTPKSEIGLIKNRLKIAEEYHAEWQAKQKTKQSSH